MITEKQENKIPCASTLIQNKVSLKDKNWFQTGGLAEYYCEPTTVEEFQLALSYARQHQLAVFLLGKGANVLISDHGFSGLIIRPGSIQAEYHVQDGQHLVTAGAGMDFDTLISFCLDHHLSGLEEFSGIPSTVGGATYINLHYYEFLLSDFFVSGTIINQETGEIKTVPKSWFNFGYDQSTLQDKAWFLVSATFSLRPISAEETAYARGRAAEIKRHRYKRYPHTHTCGSFFKNFSPEEIQASGQKLIYVAYYLDKLGLKGELAFGDAIISHQHANMIVNRGQATSTDILNLTLSMQKRVHDAFNIVPQPECQLIGFTDNPFERLFNE
jgi:UDP-N-acetylmuramate dehydrogenase